MSQNKVTTYQLTSQGAKPLEPVSCHDKGVK